MLENLLSQCLREYHGIFLKESLPLLFLLLIKQFLCIHVLEVTREISNEHPKEGESQDDGDLLHNLPCIGHYG